MARSTITETQLSEAKKAADQAAARYRDLKTQHKAVERRAKKKRDDRRKILAGAWVLNEMHKNAEFKAVVLAGLSHYLTREIDRQAFPELPEHH